MKALNLKSYPDEIAMVVGVEAATLFYSILLWCEYNEKHEKNFKHGHYWTYQTAEAMSKKFPYWSTFKIERLIMKLKEAELLFIDQLSPDKRVRTRWFAINHEMVESISRNHETHLAKSQNGNFGIAKCNIQVYNNTSNKEESNIIVQAQEKTCVESITTGESMHENKLFAATQPPAEPPAPALPLPFASEQFKEAWKEWQDYRKERKLKKLLPKSQEMQFAKMKKFPERQIISMIENAIQAGYQTFIFANSVPDARFNDPNFDPMKPHQGRQQAPVSFQMTEEMRKQAKEGW